MKITTDIKSYMNLGFNKHLSRAMPEQVEWKRRYVNADNIGGGTVGSEGVFNIGSSGLRMDGKMKRIVVKEGDTRVITIGKLDGGNYGIKMQAASGSAYLQMDSSLTRIIVNDGTNNRVLIGEF